MMPLLRAGMCDLMQVDALGPGGGFRPVGDAGLAAGKGNHREHPAGTAAAEPGTASLPAGVGGGAPQYGSTPPYGPPGQYPGPYAQPNLYGPPGQYPGPYGMPVPPPAKKRKLLWILLGAGGAVLVLIIVGIVVLVNLLGNATNRAMAVSDDFTRLIVNGQSSQAYDQYMDPVLTQSLTKEEFVSGVAGLGLDNSCKPDYDSVNVSSVNGTNTANLAGTLQCQGKILNFRYSFEGNDLKMDAIRLQPQG